MNHAREMTPDEEPPRKRQRVLACRSGHQCIPTEPASRTLVESHYVRALEERVAELEKQNPDHNIDHLPPAHVQLNGQTLADNNEPRVVSTTASIYAQTTNGNSTGSANSSGRSLNPIEQRPNTIVEDISNGRRLSELVNKSRDRVLGTPGSRHPAFGLNTTTIINSITQTVDIIP
ncbi:transcription factor [Fusarium beomiforme]|uniref:Transcription factor n=1 Tax=Fusarium beomiforme TaxID=44412 RepID=A0A9P5APW7_9HYPO|nr:transcription factor [Fusarium beomiforme]